MKLNQKPQSGELPVPKKPQQPEENSVTQRALTVLRIQQEVIDSLHKELQCAKRDLRDARKLHHKYRQGIRKRMGA
jgi:hypothetical protein